MEALARGWEGGKPLMSYPRRYRLPRTHEPARKPPLGDALRGFAPGHRQKWERGT